MRRILALVFVVAMASVSMSGQQAKAMTAASASALAQATSIEKVVVVCSTNGCNPVHVSPPRKKNRP